MNIEDIKNLGASIKETWKMAWLPVADIVRETEKALGVDLSSNMDSTEIRWLPKSLVRGVKRSESEGFLVEIPVWFGIKENL